MKVLKPELVLPLLRDPDVLPRLAPHLVRQTLFARASACLLVLLLLCFTAFTLANIPAADSCCGGRQPEEHQTQAGLEALVASAQFRAQLDTFDAALQAGQLDLAQFGLQSEVPAACILSNSKTARRCCEKMKPR